MEEVGNKVGPKWEKKREFFAKLEGYLEEYPRVLVVQADNVSSNQMAQIRKALRGKGILLMGKNTMMRKAVRSAVENNPDLDKLLPHIVKNIGLVFTNEEPADIRAIIDENKVGAPAKAGSIAPIDVTVPAGPTGMEPNQTSFLQALNIATKIARGQIEILNPVPLLVKGEKVGSSEAVLLEKLNIRPFAYGLDVLTVYDKGTVYSAAVLDLTEDDVVGMFVNAAQEAGAISLAIGYPTVISAPHSIRAAFQNMVKISVATDYTFKQTEEIKELLDNPEALAAAQEAAAAAAPQDTQDDDKADAEDESESESGSCGFGLFG